MKNHFSEADLLETYYMQPGDSMPVMMHLASCTECAARYERLERKMREAAVCSTKPETFWSRQRLSIVRRVAAQPARVARIGALARVAAAAVLAFALGGAVMYHEVKQDKPVPPQEQKLVVKAPTVDEMHAPINPWESEELTQFHEVVQWESWESDSSPAPAGGSSL